MPEATIELRPVRIMYICDECGKGQMVKVDKVVNRLRRVVRTLHCCSTCNHEQIFDAEYPRMEFLPK